MENCTYVVHVLPMDQVLEYLIPESLSSMVTVLPWTPWIAGEHNKEKKIAIK